MTLPLTTRQARFLALIGNMTKDGVPPTYDELSQAAGMVKSGVHRMLSALKDRGAVAFEHGRARTLRVVADQLPSLDGLSRTQLVRLRDGIDAALAAKFAEPMQ